MIHRTHKPRRLTLSALTLAALLFAMQGGHVVGARQKKSGGKVKPGAKLLPERLRQTPDSTQKPVATQMPPSILVRWQGKPGVNRYRLQLATDEKFEDVVFDQAVEGRQYVVKDLPPGNYFWRVAPAAAETSISYSRPERVTLGSEQKVEVASVVMPADATGWRVATGEVAKVAPAQPAPGRRPGFRRPRRGRPRLRRGRRERHLALDFALQHGGRGADFEPDEGRQLRAARRRRPAARRVRRRGDAGRRARAAAATRGARRGARPWKGRRRRAPRPTSTATASRSWSSSPKSRRCSTSSTRSRVA